MLIKEHEVNKACLNELLTHFSVQSYDHQL